MPRPKQFMSVRLTAEEMRNVRAACTRVMMLMPFEKKARLFAPIEPSVLFQILADIADVTGYNNSPLSLIMNHKAYYLRKRHAIYVIYKDLFQA